MLLLSNSGVFLSTINGSTGWTASGLTQRDVYAFAVSDSNIFAGTDSGGAFLSTNSGTSWTAVNNGLTNSNVTALAVSGSNIFAGTNTSGVWRREMPTAVKDDENNVPMLFSLSQNYPNPFNPSTTISFSLLSKSFVTLKVFDILGREVATIVSEEMPAGSYSRQWNAAKMSSGIYFYRLQAGAFTETKKLVLLR
jgi:hypothetical protein